MARNRYSCRFCGMRVLPKPTLRRFRDAVGAGVFAIPSGRAMAGNPHRPVGSDVEDRDGHGHDVGSDVGTESATDETRVPASGPASAH